MSDIVERLRGTRANMLGTADEQQYHDCHEAADEIERLRTELAAPAPPSLKRRRRMIDEELKALVGQLFDRDWCECAPYDAANAINAIEDLMAERDAAERKVEMLRGALKPFAEQVKRSPWIISPAMMRNAAAALADTEKTDE